MLSVPRKFLLRAKRKAGSKGTNFLKNDRKLKLPHNTMS